MTVSSDNTSPGNSSAGGARRVVDVHAHFAPLIATSSSGPDPWVSRDRSATSVWYHGSHIDSIVREVADPTILLAQEQEIGITDAVLSPWVALLPQTGDPNLAETACQRLNAAMAEAVTKDSRLSAMAAVPMIEPARAIRVLAEAKASGLTGVEIVPTVAGEFVGGDRFEEFWASVAESRTPVFIHPSSRGLGIDALQNGYLWNSVGNPVETAIVGAQLVLSGLVERYPDLKIILAHAGGVLPAVFGRIDHSFGVRPEPKSRLSHEPSWSFRRLFYDTIAHGRRELAALLEAVGPSQLLFGTDHPFDMGDYDQLAGLETLGLDPMALEAILGGTAASLFGLKAASE